LRELTQRVTADRNHPGGPGKKSLSTKVEASEQVANGRRRRQAGSGRPDKALVLRALIAFFWSRSRHQEAMR
jgi:hypothetical protein